MTTSPAPLGVKKISPSVFVDESTFASNLKLSTFHWSTFLFWSRIATKPFAAVDALAPLATEPAVLVNRSVKYLPPTTCGLPALSPTNNLSPLFACVPPVSYTHLTLPTIYSV